MALKVKYNAPIVLTFSLVCTIVLILSGGVNANGTNAVGYAFMVKGSGAFNSNNVWDYFRLVSHCMGHAGWTHLIGNLSLILVVGPILEEKYGSFKLLLMMFITALITGILNILFSDTGLLGASGIVFMMIILSSFGSFRRGEIPLTFVLVLVVYLGGEFLGTFKDDMVSQSAHIIGGICGGIFGFIIQKAARHNEEDKNLPVVEPRSTIPDSLSEDAAKKDDIDQYIG